MVQDECKHFKLAVFFFHFIQDLELICLFRAFLICVSSVLVGNYNE